MDSIKDLTEIQYRAIVYVYKYGNSLHTIAVAVGCYKTSVENVIDIDGGEITLYNKMFLLKLLKLLDGEIGEISLIYEYIKNVKIIVEIIVEIKKIENEFHPQL
ncbi:hypothetical protein C2G38_2162539 [Gigaspora rosea]|uniref:Uncharacterized protein n=1 Tax=Gigaspora rosea TaxID=44941 RepID=A0A397VYA3_9GLOM|nr:hypothetical protein C2G38_2162539 [Gigaspora rosea]